MRKTPLSPRDGSSKRRLASSRTVLSSSLAHCDIKSGKVVLVWAFKGDCDPVQVVSNTCDVEWPPRSKKRIVIPEVDRGAWFSPADAAIFVREEQRPLLLRLEQQLRAGFK